MEMIYDESKAAMPREATALNATVLPILIRARRQDMQKEVKIAFKGMSQPGLTFTDSLSNAEIPE